MASTWKNENFLHGRAFDNVEENVCVHSLFPSNEISRHYTTWIQSIFEDLSHVQLSCCTLHSHPEVATRATKIELKFTLFDVCMRRAQRKIAFWENVYQTPSQLWSFVCMLQTPTVNDFPSATCTPDSNPFHLIHFAVAPSRIFHISPGHRLI